MSGGEPSEGAAARNLASRAGWLGLVVWATAGLGLEALHAFKLAAYLDDPATRFLLVLAHAHGVGLSLVNVAWSLAERLHARPGARATSVLLATGAALLPAGFALGVVGQTEVDPGVGVLLAPVGALATLAGLARAAYSAIRAERT